MTYWKKAQDKFESALEENEHLKKRIDIMSEIILKQAEIISFIREDDFLAYVGDCVDCENCLQSDVDAFESRFDGTLNYVRLDFLMWKVGYTLDGEDYEIEFGITDHKIDDLAGAIAKEIVNQAEATAV